MKKYFEIGIFVVSIMVAQAVFAQSNGGESFKDIAFEYVLNNIESIKARPWKVKSTSYDKMPNGDYIVRLTISRTLTLQEEGLVNNQVHAYGTTFNVGVRRGYVYTDYEDSKSYLVFVDRFGKPTRYVGAPENHAFHYWNGNAWLFTNKQNDKSGNKDLDYFYNMICYKNNGEIQWKGLDVNIYGWAYSGKNLYLVGTYHDTDIPVIRTINTNTFEYTDKRNACSGIPYHIEFSDEGLIISEYKPNGKTASFTYPYAVNDRQFQAELVLKRYDLTKASDQIALGERYLNGDIVDKDEYKAFELFEKAANLSNTIGLYKLGLCYKEGIGTLPDNTKALQLFERAANKGNAEAMKALSDMYAEGDGIQQDINKALFWKERLAFEGDIKAQEYILSRQSIEYEKSNVTAAKAFQVAHNSFNAKNYGWAQFCYERAISLGSIDAMREYGKWLLYGGSGMVIPNTHKGLELLEKAANQGEIQSMKILGDWYEEQKDKKSAKMAAFWVLKVAEFGDIEAHKKAGFYYLNGIGVKKNEKKGCQMLEAVNDQKDLKVLRQLAICYGEGKGVKRNLKKACNYIATMWRILDLTPQYSTDEVDKDGELCYIRGMREEEEKSIVDAKKWYKKGMELGNRKSKKAYYRLTPQEKPKLFRIVIY